MDIVVFVVVDSARASETGGKQKKTLLSGEAETGE